MSRIRGVTWGNDRGTAPLLDTLELWRSVRPDVEVEWSIRPLADFAHASLSPLARDYDLVVFDHPHLGDAVASGLFAPLDEIAPADVLEAQQRTITNTYASYRLHGRSWAFAIDAASQVAARRPDLLSTSDLPAAPPWTRVLEITNAQPRSQRAVALPFVPVLACMSFLSICANLGEEPFSTDRFVAPRSTGRQAVDLLREIVGHAHPQSPSLNDVAAFELMAETDEVAYIPLAFGYSNYSRIGYRTNRVLFEDVPQFGRGPRGAILGGAGLAVSAHSRFLEASTAYASWLASPEVQRTAYVAAGGQPAQLAAWEDAAADAQTGGFFSRTRATMDACYLRPRYAGFIAVQERMGELISDCVVHGRDVDSTLSEIDKEYIRSLAQSGDART